MAKVRRRPEPGTFELHSQVNQGGQTAAPVTFTISPAGGQAQAPRPNRPNPWSWTSAPRRTAYRHGRPVAITITETNAGSQAQLVATGRRALNVAVNGPDGGPFWRFRNAHPGPASNGILAPGASRTFKLVWNGRANLHGTRSRPACTRSRRALTASRVRRPSESSDRNSAQNEEAHDGHKARRLNANTTLQPIMSQRGNTTVRKQPPIAFGLSLALVFASLPQVPAAPVVEKVEYRGWKNNLKLTNGDAELIVTLDVGPRVISYKLAGGTNVFKNYDEMMGKSGEADWMIRGGHRLWAAPEDTDPDLRPRQRPGRLQGTRPRPASGSPPRPTGLRAPEGDRP